MVKAELPELATTSARFALRRGRCHASSWFKVPSVLPDVLAIHTLEMIPRSMILQLSRSEGQYIAANFMYERCVNEPQCFVLSLYLCVKVTFKHL